MGDEMSEKELKDGVTRVKKVEIRICRSGRDDI